MGSPELIVREISDNIPTSTINEINTDHTIIEELLENIINTITSNRKRKLHEEGLDNCFSLGTSIYTNKLCKRNKKPNNYKNYTHYNNHNYRKYNSKLNKKRNYKNKKKPIAQPILKEDPNVKQSRLLRLSFNMNPYYAHNAINEKIKLEKSSPPIHFKGIRKQQIYLILPNRKPYYMPYTSAHLHLQYFSGTLFDWQLKLKEINLLKPYFCQNSIFKFKLSPSKIYGPSSYFTRAANEIYETNQHIRWLFKRLVNSWLYKKSQSRQIGADSDINSLDAIPEKEQIHIACITSRSIYVFSGNSLCKTIRSSLESQSGSISNVKAPKNPFTNIIFTYGQMVKVCSELGKWCANKGKPYPAIIALYQEAKFNTIYVLNLHNNYLQYLATKTYIFNDDQNGYFFLENLEVLFDSYQLYLVKFERYLDIELFRSWLQDDPTDINLKNWRQLVCDYWHYKQTDHFVRPSWTNEISIAIDLEIMLKVSESTLRTHL